VKAFQYLLTVVAFTISISSSGLSQGPCVDFDTSQTPLNTRYSAPKQSVISLPSVNVTVDKFLFADGTAVFNSASVETVAGFGSNRVLRLNNVNLVVEYISSTVKQKVVSFDFLDKGGIENFSVNGSKVNVGDISSLPLRINNVQISVKINRVPNGKSGRVTMRGLIKQFAIGGQEFWVDNICQ
jgi:hypothetical protein